MKRVFKARGRLHGRRIDLDESLRIPDGAVEVTVRSITDEDAGKTVGDLLALVATFPPTTHSKEDIDRQLAADRASWNR